jgi:predicted O-methyltransferase YrrM
MHTILQDETELRMFVDLVRDCDVRAYLEVGAKFGGTLRRVAYAMPQGSRVVAVDLSDGDGARDWRASQVALRAAVADLNQHGYDAKVIWGDSTDAAVIKSVSKLAPFDLILIDANHTLPFVTKDWENYAPLGRMVAFHDIAWRRAPEWKGTRIDVPQFWDSIKAGYLHEEIRACPTRKNNGIGVIFMDVPVCNLRDAVHA